MLQCTFLVLLMGTQALSLSLTGGRPLSPEKRQARQDLQAQKQAMLAERAKQRAEQQAELAKQRAEQQAEKNALLDQRKSLNQPTNYTPQLAPISTANLMKCPTMPDSPAAWQQSFLWAVFIDGKDARKGPHVYDWDQSFFFKVSGMLSDIYAAEKTEEGRQPLSLELVKKYRKQTYGDELYNMVCRKLGNGGGRVSLTADWEERVRAGQWACKNGKGGSDIMPRCTDRMECKDVTALLSHIPEYLYSYEPKMGDGCYRGLEAYVANGTKAESLERLIADYNTNLSKLTSAGANKDELLEAVVKFTRAFAFLHPFKNGNGRLRNILLQREIRRLGIGCGTMMYNYNKDAFVDGFERYVSKVREGLEMFEAGWSVKSNPWLDKAKTNEHVQKFEILSGLEKCAKEDSIGSGGTINLDHSKPQKILHRDADDDSFHVD